MKYHIAVANQKQGPFTLEELKNQPLTPETLVWRTGMPSWVRADQIPELQVLSNSLPSSLPVTSQQVAKGVPVAPSPAPAGKSAGASGLWASGAFVLVSLIAGYVACNRKPESIPAPTPKSMPAVPVPKSKTEVPSTPRLNVSGQDATGELQQFCGRLSDDEIAALGLSVILTGADFYGARMAIQNTGNVPIRVYPGNIGIHFGDEIGGIIPIDHPSFLQQCVLQPGQVANGLVMYRARVDIGVAMRLGGGGISYNDASIQVTYDR